MFIQIKKKQFVVRKFLGLNSAKQIDDWEVAPVECFIVKETVEEGVVEVSKLNNFGIVKS